MQVTILDNIFVKITRLPKYEILMCMFIFPTKTSLFVDETYSSIDICFVEELYFCLFFPLNYHNKLVLFVLETIDIFVELFIFVTPV